MRKWAALLAAALLLSLLTACLTQSGQEEEGARLWFITPSAQQKIQVTPALASCVAVPQERVGEYAVPRLIENYFSRTYR